MSLQRKRQDERQNDFSQLFDVPELDLDPNKDRFLGKKQTEETNK